MIKVGEHITIDFLGVKKDYSPEFYEKVIYKIAKAAKVEVKVQVYQGVQVLLHS